MTNNASSVEHVYSPREVAIISRCENRSRIGLLVRIIGRHETPEFDWDVELLGSPITGRAIDSGRVGIFRQAAVFGWNLSPLLGPGRSNQESDQQEAHAEIQKL